MGIQIRSTQQPEHQTIIQDYWHQMSDMHLLLQENHVGDDNVLMTDTSLIQHE